MKTLTQASNRAKPNATTSAEFRRQLKAELTTAGCFAPAPLQQTAHMILIVLVYGAGYALLLTGFNLNFFRFAIALDGQAIDTRGINFYKSMMMGGLPNYFQPFGPPHTSFTRRVETISRLIVKIILHMQQRGLESVSIPRQAVAKRPRITPNYVMRKLDDLPAFHGALELPSIDNLLFYRFNPGDYQFYVGHKKTSPPPSLGQQARIRETA